MDKTSIVCVNAGEAKLLNSPNRNSLMILFLRYFFPSLHRETQKQEIWIYRTFARNHFDFQPSNAEKRLKNIKTALRHWPSFQPIGLLSRFNIK
jgi:hypothetical protein